MTVGAQREWWSSEWQLWTTGVRDQERTVPGGALHAPPARSMTPPASARKYLNPVVPFDDQGRAPSPRRSDRPAAMTGGLPPPGMPR